MYSSHSQVTQGGAFETHQKSTPLPLLGWICQIAIALVLLSAVALGLRSFPVVSNPLAWALTIYGLLLFRFPWLWLFAIPLCLPVLDLSLWSGRFFFTEFDMLVMVSAAVGLLRRDPWVSALHWKKRYWLLVLVIICWQVMTTWRGLTPLPLVDTNSFVSFYSKYNSLRLFKGFALGLLMLPLLGQSLARREDTAQLFVAGMVLGGLAGIAALFWERALFTGLLNFTKEYRATGLFSITATGGAAVDAHLLITLPFFLAVFLIWRNVAAGLLGVVLCCLGLYATAITFSRANYPALAAGLAVFGAGWLYQLLDRQSGHSGWKFGKVWLLLLFIPVVGYFFLSNPYIANRFSTTRPDLQVRLDHWSYVVGMTENREDSGLYGMGKGSFPREYYFSMPNNEVAATALHWQDGGERYIRFSESDHKGDMYLRQRFSYAGDGAYRLKISLRTTEAKPARILVEFCERLVFRAFSECRWLGIDAQRSAGRWEEYNKPITLSGFGRRQWYGSRPVEIAILNRGVNQPLDVGKVELYGPHGGQLLHNTDFEAGWDRWSFYSGDHLAWHIKNIFVDGFFEGGWPGLIILILLLAAAFLKLFAAISTGSVMAVALAASLTGGIMVGLFDSLFDEPKITLLFYTLVWAILSLNAPAFALAGTQEMRQAKFGGLNNNA